MGVGEFFDAVEATFEQARARAAAIGDRGAAGPDEPPALDDVEHAWAPTKWNYGWWAGAIRMPAHPGRVGGPIAAWSLGAHTTDMLPAEWGALVQAWCGRVGDGACAHFLIGRDAAHGVLQFVPITRNGNHLGGDGHGVFDTARATGIHPNLVAVGVEFHCAGGVRLVNGVWRLVENGVAHGEPLPDADVIPDPQRPSRGWHTITDYQRQQFLELRTDLELVLGPLPAGARTRVTGAEQPDAFTVMPTARLVTHAQTNPEHRADPWRPVCDWLRGL